LKGIGNCTGTEFELQVYLHIYKFEVRITMRCSKSSVEYLVENSLLLVVIRLIEREIQLVKLEMD